MQVCALAPDNLDPSFGQYLLIVVLQKDTENRGLSNYAMMKETIDRTASELRSF